MTTPTTTERRPGPGGGVPEQRLPDLSLGTIVRLGARRREVTRRRLLALAGEFRRRGDHETADVALRLAYPERWTA